MWQHDIMLGPAKSRRNSADCEHQPYAFLFFSQAIMRVLH
jgi:hypothetical protein